MFKIFNIILITGIIFGCGKQLPEPEPDKTTENKMYVYSNRGKTFYLVDYKTFEIVKEINLKVADTVSIGGMTLSSNRDYLFFKATGLAPFFRFGFVLYNIKTEKLQNVFFTKFIEWGAAYFISAHNNLEPGLIYVHFRDLGTYSIDLFEQNVKEFISAEHDFILSKRIYHSPNGKWTVVKKNWADDGRTELEFYTAGSDMHDLQFVLNQENKDSLLIYDFEFSKDNKLYITIIPGPVRGAECNVGSYDLETKQLYRSALKFQWSLNPYYTAYSPGRNELYTIGAYDTFYVIGTDTYEIKDTIVLTGKITGSSQIQVSPDENVVFVSCPSSNAIFVMDLNSRRVIKIINITRPYNMVIP